MSETLRGHTALVTGASRGLGAAIAKTLADSGARVVVNYARSEVEADNVVAGIETAGGEAAAIRADVTDPMQVRGLVADTERLFGPVDILVNNATGPQPMKRLEDYTWDDFQHQLDFFVKAPVLLMQAILPGMRRQGWGRVVNIGSEVVDLGAAEYSAYVAAKAAMVGLTRSWARELGPNGVTVNLVAPGWIPVERHAHVARSDLANYAAGVPLGRQGVPEDVAQAVAFLASEEANFITGQCLSVNGGNTF